MRSSHDNPTEPNASLRSLRSQVYPSVGLLVLSARQENERLPSGFPVPSDKHEGPKTGERSGRGSIARCLCSMLRAGVDHFHFRRRDRQGDDGKLADRRHWPIGCKRVGALIDVGLDLATEIDRLAQERGRHVGSRAFDL